MSFLDSSNPLISTIFGAKPAAGVPTYEQLQMRRKIAETLLGQKNKYPKTLGEGLGAIGEAIGERGLLNQADKMAQEREAGVGPEYDRVMGNPTAAPAATSKPLAYAPEPDTTDMPSVARSIAPPIPPLVAPGNLPPTGEPGNDGSTHFPPPFQTTPAQRDAMPPGPRSDVVVPPDLNQSVALNQAAPPAPIGPPLAFSGQPTSDAPPIGMPLSGQAPPPPDARAAIAGAITPKPPPIVAPPVPPPPGPQIAQAPPQPQIRVPAQGQLKPPDAPQMTPQMREIAVFSGKLGPDDPRRQGLQLRYEQLKAAEQDKYNQQLEEYRYRRGQAEPEKSAALRKAQEEANTATAGGVLTRNTGLPANVVVEHFKAMQPAAERDVALIRNARLAKEMLDNGVISGAGADLKVNIARAKAVWGDIPAAELVSRSERALAATKAMVGYGLNQYQPGDTRVTNSDTIVSGQIVGGDPSQQEKTRKELVNMVLQDSHRRIGEYERQHDTAFKDSPALEMFKLRTDPIHNDPAIAKGAVDILLKNPTDRNNIEKFNQHFGPGAAELEIARAERRARRGQQ